MCEELKPCPTITGSELSALRALVSEKAFLGPDGGLWTESGPLEVDVAKAIGTVLGALEWHQQRRPIEEDLRAENAEFERKAFQKVHELENELAHKGELIKRLEELVAAHDAVMECGYYTWLEGAATPEEEEECFAREQAARAAVDEMREGVREG